MELYQNNMGLVLVDSSIGITDNICTENRCGDLTYKIYIFTNIRSFIYNFCFEFILFKNFSLYI